MAPLSVHALRALLMSLQTRAQDLDLLLEELVILKKGEKSVGVAPVSSGVATKHQERLVCASFFRLKNRHTKSASGTATITPSTRYGTNKVGSSVLATLLRTTK